MLAQVTYDSSAYKWVRCRSFVVTDMSLSSPEKVNHLDLSELTLAQAGSCIKSGSKLISRLHQRPCHGLHISIGYVGHWLTYFTMRHYVHVLADLSDMCSWTDRMSLNIGENEPHSQGKQAQVLM